MTIAVGRHAPSPAAFWERVLDNRTVLSILCLAPAVLLLMVFLTYPLGLGVWLGFTDARIGRPGIFIGLENYWSLLDDGIFRLAVFNTILYTTVATVV